MPPGVGAIGRLRRAGPGIHGVPSYKHSSILKLCLGDMFLYRGSFSYHRKAGLNCTLPTPLRTALCLSSLTAGFLPVISGASSARASEVTVQQLSSAVAEIRPTAART